MKKIILFVIGVLLMAVLVTAVLWFGSTIWSGSTEPPTTDSPTDDTSAPTTPSTEGTHPPADIHAAEPMVSISLPVLQETDIAADGNLIFTRTFQDVVLSIPDADITRAVTLDLLRRMDTNSSVLSAIQAGALADYAGQENWMPYYYQILYSPERIDQTVLSLFGIEDTYSAAVSGKDGISVNYDLRTGTVLKLRDILTEESSAADRLLTALLEALAEKEGEYMLFDDYADTVTDLFRSDSEQESGWYFSSGGLCFFFSPYDIAPNSAGVVTATVPYSALPGILRDIYFPGEQVPYAGELTGVPFSRADLDGFSHFSELITDPDAPRYVLSTNGVLYDLQIDLGSWVAESRFEAETVIYSANLLSPDDAFVLRSHIPVTESPLRLRCRTGESEYCFYLNLDPATDTIVFTPAES